MSTNPVYVIEAASAVDIHPQWLEHARVSSREVAIIRMQRWAASMPLLFDPSGPRRLRVREVTS